MDVRFKRNLLDFYLNANFSPRTDYFFNVDSSEYLTETAKLYSKAIICDWDGVFNKKGDPPLYKIVWAELGVENNEVKIGREELERIDDRIRRPEDVVAGERELIEFFRRCHLKGEEFRLANTRAAEQFLEYYLKRGSREFVSKVKDKMGYLPAVLSGCSKIALETVAHIIGFSTRNIFGTPYFFNEDDEFVGMHLLLGWRKPEKRRQFLQQNIGTRYGCSVILEDDIMLGAPQIKTGISPSIIVGKYKRNEIPFDIVTCCPEAEDDLEKVIPAICRFEYGWVTINLIPQQDIDSIFDLSRSVVEAVSTIDKSNFHSTGFSIAKGILQILEIKSRYHLVFGEKWIRELVARLIIADSFDDVEKIKNQLLTFCQDYIPELHIKP